MPLYYPDHVEYEVNSGHIQIAMENGTMQPAYWAYPTRGGTYPGIVLLHDWWGLTSVVRRMTMQFAQVGHYVITPDFFYGETARTHTQALALMDRLADNGYPLADAAISVLENHNNCNQHVAVIGLGLGGSLAFEAAIKRHDVEAAVAFGGFPQRYLGQFSQAQTPVMALYGNQDRFIPRATIEQLRQELNAATTDTRVHEVVLLAGAQHDIFADNLPPSAEDIGRVAWHKMLDFIEARLLPPTNPPERKPY